MLLEKSFPSIMFSFTFYLKKSRARKLFLTLKTTMARVGVVVAARASVVGFQIISPLLGFLDLC